MMEFLFAAHVTLGSSNGGCVARAKKPRARRGSPAPPECGQNLWANPARHSPVVLQRFDVVQAVYQGPPNPIQFPDQQAVNFLALASFMRRFNPGQLDLAMITSS
jgi:hypothetical protein